MRKAIIFGANGQDGYYLSKLLKLNSINVINTSRKCGDFTGNVGDYNFVKNLIEDFTPEYIFHFAANSSTRHEILFENHVTISTGTLNILEAVKLYSGKSKVFICGSAMQFKNTGDPIDENVMFEAESAYSASRIYSTYLARYYRNKFGLKVYVGYLFNHDSSIRSESHFNQKVVIGVKKILAGNIINIELGNLNLRKEYGFAGDVVEAIWILINQDKVYEVVIGTGKSYSLNDWVKICFEKVGLDWRNYVVYDNNLPIEYKALWSNPNKIMSLGWIPKVDIHTLADMMINSKTYPSY